VLRSDLAWAINGSWDLRWQLAHRSASQDFDHYFGGTYNAATRLLGQNYAWQETANKTLSSALTLNGRFATGAIEHKLTAGLDWSREKRDPLLSTRRDQPINPFAAPDTWGRLNPRPAATLDNHHRAHSAGLFVQDLISLRPDVKVLVGGRHDRYKFRSTNIRKQSSGYDGSTFSPNVGVVWDINADHTVYAAWNRSFAPYGGNGYLTVDATANPATFNTDPEQSRQIEVGVKSDWLDRKLSTTLSVYNLEHTNIRYRPDPNDLTRWAVRGKERSRGVELNVMGRVHPQWFVRGSLGLMSAKIVENRQNRAEEGRYLTNTARINGNLFVRYAPRPWFAEAGLTHIGKRYYYISNEEHGLPAFTRLDALVGYSAAPWNFTLALQNVTNKKYWRSNAMPGSPRAVMLKASYEF
jgi:tonB-dependent siderophore receptor